MTRQRCTGSARSSKRPARGPTAGRRSPDLATAARRPVPLCTIGCGTEELLYGERAMNPRTFVVAAAVATWAVVMSSGTAAAASRDRTTDDLPAPANVNVSQLAGNQSEE